ARDAGHAPERSGVHRVGRRRVCDGQGAGPAGRNLVRQLLGRGVLRRVAGGQAGPARQHRGRGVSRQQRALPEQGHLRLAASRQLSGRQGTGDLGRRRNRRRHMRLKTLIVHGGHGPDPATGAVNVPIYLSSTYAQERPGVHRGYEYSRTGNPTRTALENLAAELEGGVRGLAFASGMAAMSTVLSLLDAGDHVVVGDDVYGGTYRVVARGFKRLGIPATYADTADPEDLARRMRPETRTVIAEPPTNPLSKVADLRALADVAHRAGAWLVVDNTFMTPYWQQPLTVGADIVVHSATKYLSGHSDVVAGLVVVKDVELGERLHYLQNAVGGVL